MRRVVTAILRDERARFILVGGINTVLGYGLFALFFLLFGARLDIAVGDTAAPVLCVYASYIVAVPVAFILHRRFTFRAEGSGRVAVDFLRFCIIYVVALVLNTVALPLVERTHLPTLLAQAIVQAVIVVLTYFGHKLFSFRRSGSRSDQPGESEQELARN